MLAFADKNLVEEQIAKGGYKVPATDKNPHYYERGADYTPQVRASSDAGLRSGASHSYLQSGMLYAPGMMAPSGSRPAALNH